MLLLADWITDLLSDKWTLAGAALLVVVALIGLMVFFSFFRLWLQSKLTNAKIGILDLVGMKFRQVDYGMIVRQKIALVQSGVQISTQDLESHYLSRGNVPKTSTAVIA